MYMRAVEMVGPAPADRGKSRSRRRESGSLGIRLAVVTGRLGLPTVTLARANLVKPEGLVPATVVQSLLEVLQANARSQTPRAPQRRPRRRPGSDVQGSRAPQPVAVVGATSSHAPGVLVAGLTR